MGDAGSRSVSAERPAPASAPAPASVPTLVPPGRCGSRSGPSAARRSESAAPIAEDAVRPNVVAEGEASPRWGGAADLVGTASETLRHRRWRSGQDDGKNQQRNHSFLHRYPLLVSSRVSAGMIGVL